MSSLKQYLQNEPKKILLTFLFFSVITIYYIAPCVTFLTQFPVNPFPYHYQLLFLLPPIPPVAVSAVMAVTVVSAVMAVTVVTAVMTVMTVMTAPIHNVQNLFKELLLR